LIIAFTSADYS